MRTSHIILFACAFVLAAAMLSSTATAYGYGMYGQTYRTNSPMMYGGQYTSYGYGSIGGYRGSMDGYHVTSPYNQYPVRNVYVYENPQFRGHQSTWDYSTVYRNGYTGMPRSQMPTFSTSIPLASRSMTYY